MTLARTFAVFIILSRGGIIRFKVSLRFGSSRISEQPIMGGTSPKVSRLDISGRDSIYFESWRSESSIGIDTLAEESG